MPNVAVVFLLRSTAFDSYAHGTSGTSNDLHCSLDVVCIEVGHLDLSDFTELLNGKLANLLELRDTRSALETKLFLDQECSRRGLAYEIKGLIFVDGDLYRDDGAGLVLRSGIECLAELHDVNALCTKCRTNRRSRICSASRNLELNKTRYILLSHFSKILSTEISCLPVYDKRLHEKPRPHTGA